MTKLKMNSKNFLEINDYFENSNVTYFDSAEKNLIPTHIKSQYLSPDKDISWARSIIKDFISAEKAKEIVFTHCNSHSFSLIASGLKKFWRPNDTIIIPETEYFTNYEVWKKLSEETDCFFETINVIRDGRLDLGHLEEILENSTGKILFSMSHVSNSTGHVQPVRDLFSLIKQYDGLTVLDATFSINHEQINVCEDLIDFLVFNSSNCYNYPGISVLYAKQKLLEKIDPLFVETIDKLSYPEKLETKQLNLNGIVSLAKSLDWIQGLGLDNVKSKYLLTNASIQMIFQELDFIEVFHPNFYKGGIITFNIKGKNCLDVQDFLRSENIEVSAGLFDSKVLLEEKYINGLLRVSWALNNTKDDVLILKDSLKKLDK